MICCSIGTLAGSSAPPRPLRRALELMEESESGCIMPLRLDPVWSSLLLCVKLLMRSLLVSVDLYPLGLSSAPAPALDRVLFCRVGSLPLGRLVGF